MHSNMLFLRYHILHGCISTIKQKSATAAAAHVVFPGGENMKAELNCQFHRKVFQKYLIKS